MKGLKQRIDNLKTDVNHVDCISREDVNEELYKIIAAIKELKEPCPYDRHELVDRVIKLLDSKEGEE